MGGIRPLGQVLAGDDQRQEPDALLLEQRQHLALERPVAEGLARQMGQVEEASVGGGAHADSIPKDCGSCQPGPTEAFPARPEPGRAEDFHRYGEEPVNDVRKRRAGRVSMLAGGV